MGRIVMSSSNGLVVVTLNEEIIALSRRVIESSNIQQITEFKVESGVRFRVKVENVR